MDGRFHLFNPSLDPYFGYIKVLKYKVIGLDTLVQISQPWTIVEVMDGLLQACKRVLYEVIRYKLRN